MRQKRDLLRFIRILGRLLAHRGDCFLEILQERVCTLRRWWGRGGGGRAQTFGRLAEDGVCSSHPDPLPAECTPSSMLCLQGLGSTRQGSSPAHGVAWSQSLPSPTWALQLQAQKILGGESQEEPHDSQMAAAVCGSPLGTLRMETNLPASPPPPRKSVTWESNGACITEL